MLKYNYMLFYTLSLIKKLEIMKRQKDILRIDIYSVDGRQKKFSVSTESDILDGRITIEMNQIEGKISIKRAGIDNKAGVRKLFKIAYVYNTTIIDEVDSGVYEIEPDECDADTLTYYLTK